MLARPAQISVCTLLSFVISGALVHAASITGIVTNKTTNQPSANDNVVLVDVQAGMQEAAATTTNSAGEYSLKAPGMGAYLIRVTHQGGSYFIAAPQGDAPGNVTVYDVAPRVEGVSIDADMLLLEAGGGTLRVQERYLVRNTSLPPKAQFSDKTFEIVLPPEAELDTASATRPGGLATNTRLVPLQQKGHYTFNIPIQPDQGEKETLFEVQYHLAYSGKYTFAPHLQMPADNLVVYAAKGITFKAASGSSFLSRQEDPRVQTFVAKGIHPAQPIGFAISGEGQMPREAQSSGLGQSAGMGDAEAGTSGGNRPGGGLGVPIDSPDPITPYKWWILGGLTVVLAILAPILMRKDGLMVRAVAALPADPAFGETSVPVTVGRVAKGTAAQTQAHGNGVLLNLLKEELFAIETEKLAGTLSVTEYAEIKTGLGAVLKRTLRREAGNPPHDEAALAHDSDLQQQT